jgi:hypothetical protein
MWRLKGCPKCNGDIFVDKDFDGWYERCLQCGYNQDLETIVEVKEQPSVRKREPAAVGAGKTATK